MLKDLRRHIMMQQGIKFPTYILAGKGQGFTTDWYPPIYAGIEMDILRRNHIDGDCHHFFGCRDGAPTWAEFSCNLGASYVQRNQYFFWNFKAYQHGGQIKYQRSSLLDNTRGILAMDYNMYKIATDTATHTGALVVRTIYNSTPLSILKLGEMYGGFNRGDIEIYRITLTNNGIIEREYIPVVVEGRAGLYETVNGTIHYSDTGVDFELY